MNNGIVAPPDPALSVGIRPDDIKNWLEDSDSPVSLAINPLEIYNLLSAIMDLSHPTSVVRLLLFDNPMNQ